MKTKTVFFESKRGQLFVGLLFAFMMIMILSIMLSPLLSFIEIGVNSTVNVTNGGILEVIFNNYPVILAIAVMIAVVALVTGR